mmetsp:Transcript_97037/g.278844  ORF Transcript_97037/g.278844 Transcript_97037/m.278844 type:complete len:204 (+) Transcript_97037:604-1215(+)
MSAPLSAAVVAAASNNGRHASTLLTPSTTLMSCGTDKDPTCGVTAAAAFLSSSAWFVAASLTFARPKRSLDTSSILQDPRAASAAAKAGPRQCRATWLDFDAPAIKRTKVSAGNVDISCAATKAAYSPTASRSAPFSPSDATMDATAATCALLQRGPSAFKLTPAVGSFTAAATSSATSIRVFARVCPTFASGSGPPNVSVLS